MSIFSTSKLPYGAQRSPAEAALPLNKAPLLLTNFAWPRPSDVASQRCATGMVPALLAPAESKQTVGASSSTKVGSVPDFAPSIPALRSDIELRRKIGTPVIVFLGAPGAGKGTQASAISKRLDIPHISTGDLLRAEVAKSDSVLGQRLKTYMDAGNKFAPPEVTDPIIVARLCQPDCANGFILDGYPRTFSQIADADRLLQAIGRKIDVVIHFDVDKADLLERLEGRRVCMPCNTSYHITHCPPKIPDVCDCCHGPLVQRRDDTSEVISRRMEAYESEATHIVEHFQKLGILHTVRATEKPGELTETILDSLQQAADTRLNMQLGAMSALLRRPLSVKEASFVSTMIGLVEECGGEIENGIFVTRPGVALLCHSDLQLGAVPAPLADWVQKPLIASHAISATFMLAGISAETAMEFIGHGEAAVARLTTSKTNAMNAPLYRVQGAKKAEQEAYISEVAAIHSRFEQSSAPRTEWGSDSELFNRMNPGSKATALTYTMTLANFHKLFIGRLAKVGNELEVREVAATMCKTLHALYPDIISTPEAYEQMGNGAKYKGAALTQQIPSEAALLNELLQADEARRCETSDGQSFAAVCIGNSCLTASARRIFSRLFIDSSQSEDVMLAEFRSRLTYLSFLNREASSAEFVHRMTDKLQHLSVMSATWNNALVAGISPERCYDLVARAAMLGGSGHIVYRSSSLAGEQDRERAAVLLSLSPKGFVKLINDLRAESGSEYDALAHLLAGITPTISSLTMS